MFVHPAVANTRSGLVHPMGRWPQFLGIFHIFSSYLWLVEAIIDIPRILPSCRNCGSLLEPMYLVPFESLYISLYTPGIVSPISPVISPCSHQTLALIPLTSYAYFDGLWQKMDPRKGHGVSPFPPLVSHIFPFSFPYFPIFSPIFFHMFP